MLPAVLLPSDSHQLHAFPPPPRTLCTLPCPPPLAHPVLPNYFSTPPASLYISSAHPLLLASRMPSCWAMGGFSRYNRFPTGLHSRLLCNTHTLCIYIHSSLPLPPQAPTHLTPTAPLNQHAPVPITATRFVNGLVTDIRRPKRPI